MSSLLAATANVGELEYMNDARYHERQIDEN